jgi:hypothetical protein
MEQQNRIIAQKVKEKQQEHSKEAEAMKINLKRVK